MRDYEFVTLLSGVQIQESYGRKYRPEVVITEEGATILVANQTEESKSVLDLSTRLAIERTRAAYERTMMSWVRTATSLITFGFAVYKFFEIQRAAEPSNRLIGPREFSLVLISLGLFSLVVAVWQNRENIQMLKAQYPQTSNSLAGTLAGMIAILGILALIAVFQRL